MTPSKIKRRYFRRIYKLMEAMKSVLELHSCCCDDVSYYEGDRDEIWSLIVNRAPEPEADEATIVDISFRIMWSEHTDGEKGGVAFGIDLVACGGEIVGGCVPFNYTGDLWVPRRHLELIEKRFRMLEEMNHEEIPPLLHNFWERNEDAT